MISKNKNKKTNYKLNAAGVLLDWKVKRLREICTTFKSGDGITSNDISDDGKYSVYGGNGLRGFTSSFTHDGEYILIGRQGALCGNINLITGRNYVSEHAIAVQTNEENDIGFLAHKLIFLNLNRLSESSAQPGLSIEKLVKLKVSIPTKDEQVSIANLLSTWDRAIALTAQLIAAKEQRKKWFMQQLLTGKKRLRKFADKPWIRLGAAEIFENVSIKGNGKEELLSATQDQGIIPRSMLTGRVTMPSNGTDSFKLVKVGNFVISLRSFQGGLEYSYFRGLVSPAYTVLKSQKEINSEFYKFYFKSYDFIGHLAVAVIGIRDGKQISYEDFCFVRIPSPAKEEQDAIANILLTADKEVAIIGQKLEKLKEQKKGLMQLLLTGKKRIIFNVGK